MKGLHHGVWCSVSSQVHVSYSGELRQGSSSVFGRAAGTERDLETICGRSKTKQNGGRKRVPIETKSIKFSQFYSFLWGRRTLYFGHTVIFGDSRVEKPRLLELVKVSAALFLCFMV